MKKIQKKQTKLQMKKKRNNLDYENKGHKGI